MTAFSGFVAKFSRFLEIISGLFLTAMVSLIVVNILARVITSQQEQKLRSHRP